MKIAIFGDSFADPLENTKLGISWTRLLSINYGHEVENFAEPGASLWWCYERLLEHPKNIDYIIFVVTAWGRTSSNQKLFDGKYFHIPQTGFIDEDLLKRFNYNKDILRFRDSLTDYFKYFQNEKKEQFLHKQIIKEVIKECERSKIKLLLIPAFGDSVEYQSIFKISLFDTVMKDIKVNTGSDTYLWESNRPNHMSKKNNEIFSGLIHEILKGVRNSVDMNDFVFEKVPNPEDYWKIK